MPNPFVHRFVPNRIIQFLAGGLLLTAPFVALADDPATEAPSYSEKTSTAFQTLGPLVEAKNYQGAIDLLLGMIPGTDPQSYDMSGIQDEIWKVYYEGLDNAALALPHLEQVLVLVDAHPTYLPPKERIDHLQFASQLSYVAGLAIKNNAALQGVYYDKAMGFMKRFLDLSPHPKSDDVYLYAVLVYQKAVADNDKVDLNILREARVQTIRALGLEIRPRENLYQLLAVADQQLGDLVGAARTLEWLVTLKPMNKDFWSQLMAIYINLASAADKNPIKMREYDARAINVIERAQKLGFLNHSRENYDLVSMYNQVGQFGTATELMKKGLEAGQIDSNENNWLSLAYFYEQMHRNPDAISTLVEAQGRFPESGEIDRSIADIYQEDENNPKAYEYNKSAIAKGHLTTAEEVSTYQRLAYAAYELEKYDEALVACDKALSLPKAPKKELMALRDGIEKSIARQAAVKAAIKQSSL